MVLKKQNWAMQVNNISEPIIKGNALEFAKPTVKSTLISFDILLSNPGDEIIYLFDIENSGLIDVKLETIPVITGISEELSDNISFVISHADDEPILKKEEIKSGESSTYKLSIKCLKNESIQQIRLNITTILLFVQK